MDLALIGGTYLTEDSKGLIIKDGVLIIQDKKISEIGKKSDIDFSGRNLEKIYLTENHIVMPGLINTHTHLAMTLLRGYSDDKILYEWLEKDIFPAELTLTPDDIFLGARLGAVESALAGVTTVNTMYHSANKEADALQSVGVRGVVGNVCFSQRKEMDLHVTEELIKHYHDSGLIRVSIDPHAPYSCDNEFILKLKELIDRYSGSIEHSDLMWHMHIAETKDDWQKTKSFLQSYIKQDEIEKFFPNKSIFEYLDNIGIFKSEEIKIPMVAAHCVALEPLDYKIMKKNKVKVASNPVSNLKLGSGIAPIPELLKEKILVGIGTDGASSNNSLDLFDSMKIMALIHKGFRSDPTLVKAEQVVSMATSQGAEVLSYKDLGKLKKDYMADLIIINFRKPHLSPVYNFYSHLAYAVRANDVETTIINGKIVVENNEPTTVDLEPLMDEVNEKKQNLLLKVLENLA
ncbi:MAG: Atrazine chlorohydrolase [Candidatus Heimdallarchaeota archaeon LC_3]|nr:MAG: Atrazine chlorohydrolase [Candidatus Heimdallarchaeota archaeon LC_3]